MKLLRLGPRGAEIPCVLDAEGNARDVSTLVEDFSPETVEGIFQTLQSLDITSLPVVSQAGVRVGTPMSQPRNIYCIGLNYSDHARESGLAVPDEPILFNKSSGTFCAPNDPILYSPRMSKLDWEVELGVVIAKPALNVSREQALEHILGYTVVNDLSERAWQQERSGQWAKGKSFPNFCPTGPLLVTTDELGDAKGLSMWLTVNGENKQNGSTDTMIFDPAFIVSYLSEFVRLEPGDLICTGTPPGVGAGMKPPQWLTIGDTVQLGIEHLGEQQQQVIAL